MSDSPTQPRPPIEALSVSTLAILGESARGPVGIATLCVNRGDYVRHFGDQQEAPVLSHAVAGFFLNGGQRCLVVNVGKPGETSAQDYVGALALLEDRTDVDLVAAPGQTAPEVHEALLTHAEEAGPRFAILDAALELPGTGVDSLARPRASAAGALYFPWIVVDDPERGEISIPPSGHVAGIFARVERELGVHRAPANVVVRGALSLSHDVSQGEHDILHPKGINVIRNFKERGLRIWGANTLDTGVFHHIQAKRTLDMIALSIQEGTRWVEEEPNLPEVQSEVRAQVAAFLRSLFEHEILPGPEGKGYFVRCDSSTNTPEVLDTGALTMDVGIALSKPGRFVVMRVVHQTI